MGIKKELVEKRGGEEENRGLVGGDFNARTGKKGGMVAEGEEEDRTESR